MYKLDPLVQKLTHFVHTDSMYKLKNLFPHSNDSNIVNNNISCAAHDTSERDQTILNELHQLDNNITFLLNIFKSYKPKKKKDCSQTTSTATNTTATATRTVSTAETVALKKSFVDELHELSSHVNNLLNYPKEDRTSTSTTTTTNAQSVQALLSRLDGKLNSLIDLFTSYPNQLVNTTTTTPSTGVVNCLLPMRIPKEPVTFIIQCNPYDPPYPVLLFLHLLVTNNFRVTIQSTNHSVLPKPLETLFDLFMVVSSGMTITDTNLHLHFIWNPLCTECRVSRVGLPLVPGAYGELILVQEIYNLFESVDNNKKNMLAVIYTIYSSFVSLPKSFSSSATLVRFSQRIYD
ncbi:unnamed protein product [Trichobilharzia szidati]|nr:unnamed protein product [Trichobilharzia szidati]